MKKLLITLTAAGALALPVGAVLAQDDGTTPDETVTTVQPERDRDRLRQHQGEEYAQCDGTQMQERSRIHVEDQTGIVTELRRGPGRGDCGAGCTGDQARLHQADGTGATRDGAGIRFTYGNGRNG